MDITKQWGHKGNWNYKLPEAINKKIKFKKEVGITIKSKETRVTK